MKGGEIIQPLPAAGEASGMTKAKFGYRKTKKSYETADKIYDFYWGEEVEILRKIFQQILWSLTGGVSLIIFSVK